MKGYCDICGTEIEVQMCCSGHECGCMGLPVDPPVCSNECYDKYMSQSKKKSQEIVAVDLTGFPSVNPKK